MIQRGTAELSAGAARLDFDPDVARAGAVGHERALGAELDRLDLVTSSTREGDPPRDMILGRVGAGSPQKKIGRLDERPYAIHGLMTGNPAASNGPVSRVATAKPWAAAIAAIYPSAVGKPLPAALACTARSA